MKKYLATVAILLAGCASTDSKVYDNALVTKPSVPIMRIEPRYPEGAQDIKGYVNAEFIINESGKVEEITILESVPKGVFDQVAINALKRWVYKPAELNGKMVKTKQQTKLEWGAK